MKMHKEKEIGLKQNVETYLTDGRPIIHETLTQTILRAAFNYRVTHDPENILKIDDLSVLRGPYIENSP